MAINVTDETVKTLQALVHDAFETNAILDRVKTVMTTTLAFPVFGNFVHLLAHRYAINIGDGVGDLLEDYNEPVEYGNIPTHVSDYSDIQSAIDAVYNAVLTYQNELNQSAKVALIVFASISLIVFIFIDAFRLFRRKREKSIL